jgi:hypothetical protein
MRIKYIGKTGSWHTSLSGEDNSEIPYAHDQTFLRLGARRKIERSCLRTLRASSWRHFQVQMYDSKFGHIIES